MHSAKILIILVVVLVNLAHAFVPCADPSGHVGHFIGQNQECAALVQTSCHRQPGNRMIGLTNHWVRGIHVKENCAKIPKFTAIATFLGPNNKYDEPHLHQHTAIFMKCEADGIRVYQQWNRQPIHNGLIHWHGAGLIQMQGDNYYTIADNMS